MTTNSSPLCQNPICGHKKEDHNNNNLDEFPNMCSYGDMITGFCPCVKFIPAQEVSKEMTEIKVGGLNSRQDGISPEKLGKPSGKSDSNISGHSSVLEPLETSNIMTAEQIYNRIEFMGLQTHNQKFRNTKFVDVSEVEKLRDEIEKESVVGRQCATLYHFGIMFCLELIDKLLKEGK